MTREPTSNRPAPGAEGARGGGVSGAGEGARGGGSSPRAPGAGGPAAGEAPGEARAPLDPAAARRARELCQAVIQEVSRAFMGPPAVPEALLTALLSRGHVLIEGVPGVAKTTLAKAFAGAVGCSFSRIQFTPDLLPADITGTYIPDMTTREFYLHPGPVFANVVLGDEINRAPAKTQSALLEAMQERQVTIDGDTRPLPAPFAVLATQNPLEHDGTYPLPDAQVDRFGLKLRLGYPSEHDELRMLSTYGAAPPAPAAILEPHAIGELQRLAEAVYAAPEILDYILAIARYTRSHPRVHMGASPRAGLSLLQASKALALARGRDFVLPDDVHERAPLVLPHRLVPRAGVDVGGDGPEAVIAEAIANVPYRDPRPPPAVQP